MHCSVNVFYSLEKTEMLMAEITDHDQKDNDNRLIWSYHSSEATTERDSNASDIIVVHEPPCRSILYAKVGGSR
jgi:hypothetical protein